MQQRDERSPLFKQLKSARNIESEMDITIEEITGRFSNETFFNHRPRIGEVKLKNVTTGFDVKANGDSILHDGVVRPMKLVIILRIKRNALGEFDPPADAKRIHHILIASFDHGVTVYHGW